MPQTYIIAEAGVNHNGSPELAHELIEAAATAGADAIKFQTFRTENLVSKIAPKAAYQRENTDKQESQAAMLEKLELAPEVYPELIAHCKQRNIEFLSTPFDDDSLKFLVNDCGIVRLKIPSGEITNAPFLLKFARTGKPLILSTGMCDLSDIEAALGVLAFGFLRQGEPKGAEDFAAAYVEAQQNNWLAGRVTLLHCTTEYPAPLNEVNLAALDTMRLAFGLPVGYSDHTQGTSVALAAVARGATIIEKHFTTDKNLPGPDHRASLEPAELKLMIEGIRQVEIAIGSTLKLPGNSETANRSAARRSLTAKTAIKQGEAFTRANLCAKRPGNGISPFRYWEMLGKFAGKDYEADDMI